MRQREIKNKNVNEKRMKKNGNRFETLFIRMNDRNELNLTNERTARKKDNIIYDENEKFTLVFVSYFLIYFQF